MSTKIVIVFSGRRVPAFSQAFAQAFAVYAIQIIYILLFPEFLFWFCFLLWLNLSLYTTLTFNHMKIIAQKHVLLQKFYGSDWVNFDTKATKKVKNL